MVGVGRNAIKSGKGGAVSNLEAMDRGIWALKASVREWGGNIVRCRSESVIRGKFGWRLDLTRRQSGLPEKLPWLFAHAPLLVTGMT